jgi:hypothetical protein
MNILFQPFTFLTIYVPTVLKAVFLISNVFIRIRGFRTTAI